MTVYFVWFIMESKSNRSSYASYRGSKTPLSPSDSVISLGSFRPSLVWLFNHIRREDQENLTKEDLGLLLGASLDNSQLDEAFTNLDVDGDGEISLDEFLAGFTRFWQEAPNTPGYETKAFTFNSLPRRKRHMQEDYYETASPKHVVNGAGGDNGGATEEGPSEEFMKSLVVLSSHNRHSIENMWRNLADVNPELVSDFEEFVAEVAGEVEGAQRALNKQREVTKQEAMQMGEEIESRLSDAHARLQIQTAIVRQQARAKLESRLVDKEIELHAVRQKLEELSARLEACCRFALQLESEVVEGQKTQSELEQQHQELQKEKHELQLKLEKSEKQLQESQSQVEKVQKRASMHLESQMSELYEKESELQKLKEYEQEIITLRDKLESYQMSASEPEDEEVARISEATPDLLATTNIRRRRHSRGSLLDEIVEQEGMASPMLRGEPLLDPSPLVTGAFSPYQRHSSMSLPNLTDVGKVGGMIHPPVYIPVYVGSHKPSLETIESPEHVREESPSPENCIQSPGDHVSSHVTTAVGHVTTTTTAMEQGLVATVQNHVTSHVTTTKDHGSSREIPSTSTEQGHVTTRMEQGVQMEPQVQEVEELQDQRRLEDEEDNSCEPLEFIENLATQPDYVFKILVVGNSYVGKSSFLMRLCTNAFSARYSSTIGVDFYSKALRIEDKIISLQLWDTAGQERFQSVTKAYYRGAHGVVLMYDISQEESFIAVKSWINSIQDNVDEMPAAMLLVGNKVDLDETNEREVSTETGETFAKMYSADFMETSAKTGYNVGNSLLMLVRTIKQRYEEEGGENHGEKGIQVKKQETVNKCCR